MKRRVKAKPSKKKPAKRVVKAKAKPPKPVKRSPRHGKRGPEKGLTKQAAGELTRHFFGAVPEDVWRKILSTQGVATPGGKLLALFDDLGFKGAGIESMCGEAGIDVRDLVKLFTEYRLGEAIVKAAEHSEEIVLGMAEDAKSRTYICKLCVGFKAVTVKSPLDGLDISIECPECGGLGRTRRAGDARARDTTLKLLGGLEDEKSGTQVNLQLNFGGIHSQAVHRGQQLLTEGRKMRQAASPAPTMTQVAPEGPDGQ